MNMTIKKFVTLVITLISLIGVSFATDLIQVYRQALVSDQTLQSEKATYLAATQAYPQARALLLPNIGLTGSIQHINTKIISAPPFAPTGTFNLNGYEYTLTLSQPVIDFGSWWNLHLADYQIKQAAAQYAAAAQDLLLRVSQTYFNILEAEDVLRFTRSEKRATARQLDQAEQRFKVGLDAITSVYDAQASYDAVVAREIEAKNSVTNNKEDLREITNVFYDHIAKLKKQMPLLTPKPKDVEAWVNKASQYNFSIQAAKFALDAAREDIKVNFAGHLPTVDFVATYDRTKTGSPPKGTPGAINTRTTQAGLALTLPIFQGGLVTSQVRQAQYNFENAVAELENTHRQVSVGIRQTYNSIISGISKIKADKQAIKSRTASLQSTEAALKVGTRTIVDLLRAQQQLFQTQTTLATDQYEYINNTLQFKQLAGTLTVKDIRAINTWLLGNAKNQSPYNIYHVKVNTEKLKVDSHEGHYGKHKKYSKHSKHSKKIIYHKATTKIYSIQLMARINKKDVKQFAKKYHLQKQTEITTDKSNKQYWYILLYGRYNSYASAKKALSHLPAYLQKINPWIRKLS